MTTPYENTPSPGGYPAHSPNIPAGFNPVSGPPGQIEQTPYAYPPPPQPQQHSPSPTPYNMPPQQPSYGWMPPSSLPRKSGKAKTLGIVGAVVGLVVVGSVVGAVQSGGQSSSGGSGTTTGNADAGPEYKITVPQTLLNGQYTLSQDVSKQADAQVPNEGAYAHDLKTVGGQYTGGMKSIVLLGMYGVIDDPQQSVDSTIHGMTTGGKATVAVPRKEYAPNGSDSLTCGVMETSQAGQKVPVPYCVWADHSTSGNVVRSDAADIGKDPESIDVATFAQEAAKIRDEVRKPIG